MVNKRLIFYRAIASIFDYSLFSAIIFSSYKYAYVPLIDNTHSNELRFIVGLSILLPLLIWIIYFPVMESIFGYSLGKGLFNLKVMDKDGFKPYLDKTIKRHLLDLPDYLFFGLIAIIVIKRTSSNQRLGDLWAGKYVVFK